MNTLEAIRRKISAAEDLRSVVRTMKLLAAANIHQSEAAARSMDAHQETVELALSAVLRQHSPTPKTPSRPAGRHQAIVVVGSDQGLCGSFHERLVQQALTERQRALTHDDGHWRLLSIGRRLADLLPARGLEVDHVLAAPQSLSLVKLLVGQVLICIDRWQQDRGFDRLVLLHNRRIRGTDARCERVQILPLPEHRMSELRRQAWPSRRLPVWSMDTAQLFSSLVHAWLFTSLTRAIVLSLEAENASRLASMQSAETNIDRRLDELDAVLREQRQAAIDAELLALVSGSEVAHESARKRRRSS